MPWKKRWRSSLSAVWIFCCLIAMVLRQIIAMLLETQSMETFTVLNVILFLGESLRGTMFFAIIELVALKAAFARSFSKENEE